MVSNDPPSASAKFSLNSSLVISLSAPAVAKSPNWGKYGPLYSSMRSITSGIKKFGSA